MADEYDYYGRKKNKGLTGVYGDEYAENLNNAGNDFPIPDDTGAPNRMAPNAPKAGRTNTFSRQSGTGMKAVGDTNEAIANPDNAPSTRLFQAGNHDAVRSTLQNEHDPANATSTRLFQGANHDVAGKTVEGQYSLDNQPTSPFFRDRPVMYACVVPALFFTAMVLLVTVSSELMPAEVLVSATRKP